MAVLRHRGNTLYLFTPYADRNKCKCISGGIWSKQFKCWLYPFTSLGEIQEAFPDVKLPETVDKFLDLKRTAEAKLRHTTIEGGDWEHPFLMKHQKMCVDIGRTRPKFAFFLGTGTGKTIASLAIFDDRPARTLVVCPLSIIHSAWMEDGQNFYPHLRITSLNCGRDPQKRKLKKALNSNPDIFIVNFETFKILYDTLKQFKFQRIIVDESSKMKDATSQITKDLLEFSKDIPERYILSGTPAPNSPLEYYTQIDMVSPGLLGPSFYAFRNIFFEPDPDNHYKWICPEHKLQELMDRIKTVAIFIDKDDCLDLPPYTIQHIDLEMDKEQRRVYMQMQELQIAALPDNIEVLAANKLTSLMKLRQITAGFILDENKQPHFISNTKINALRELLEQIGPDSQVIIWIQFHEEVNLIKKMITETYGPNKVRALYGFTQKVESDIEIKEDDMSVRDAVIKGFKEGKFQYLIAHPKTAMYGLTFVNAAYAVYYSMSASYEEFHQSRDRLHRHGQKKNVTYYFLTCNASIDKAIYKAIERKKKVSEEVLNYLKVIKSGGSYDASDDNGS